MLFRRIKPDDYLKKFISYCKEKYGDNLAAVVIFGSYALGYFDKNKSDYDIFVFFKNKLPNEKSLKRKFPRISIIYFMTLDEEKQRLHLGNFTSYITLLTKGGRVLYSTKDYEKLLREIKKYNLLDEVFDIAGSQAKAGFEKNSLKKIKGWKAIKWALPMIRRRLQLLTFVKRKKLIWSIHRNLRKNKKSITKEERMFVKDLNNKLYKRNDNFSSKDRKEVIEICDKLDSEIIKNFI